MKLDDTLLPILYMLAAIGFILAIKWLSSPATARRGVDCRRNWHAAGRGRHSAAL